MAEENQSFIKKLINPIESYFNNKHNVSEFIELFEATGQNVDLRTDLTHEEIILVNIIKMNGEYLKSLDEEAFKDNIYTQFINSYMRLKISLERKSRGEFVDINKRERFENNLHKFNALKDLTDIKK
jgi:hypothetical protein